MAHGLFGVPPFPPNSERSAQLLEAIEKNERAFNALSERDQVLYILCGRLGAVREVYPDLQGRVEAARQYITDNYGPKFADRVLSTPELFDKLKLEPAPGSDSPNIARTVTLE